MYINIKYINVSGKQFRKIDSAKVEHHRKCLESGEDVMPIDVVKISENEYCIAGNGRHRYFAHIEAGFDLIDVNVMNE